MVTIRLCEDSQECAYIWEKNWPQQCLFDLWPVRNCFATSYKHQPYFLIAEQRDLVKGVLALSWIEEMRYFACYPGETWKGKTWLEQNKIPAASVEIYNEMIDSIPGPAHLRYLTKESIAKGGETDTQEIIDETGYLFYPGEYGFSFQKYMEQFSTKSRKKFSREIAHIKDRNTVYRYDRLDDIRYLYRMNLESFGTSSYFFEPAFLDSFEKLVLWLHQNKMLRITTLLIGGHIAAVDIGAIWKKTYTLLAGATHREFPGVAKMINFHHIQWACQQKLDEVDFLCGNFGWKERFHLTPRPLFHLYVQPQNITHLHEWQISADHCQE